MVVKTDKSGRFAIMSMDEYERAGKVHTEKDLPVDLDFLQENQRRVNGYISMLCKIFQIGDAHNHKDRVRSLKITLSLSVAPMYLLFKDHKGWSLDTGTPPPARPVVSAGSGQNDHLSEIVSHILEPVVKTWSGGMEKESTGDVLAMIDEINEEEIEIEDVDLEKVDKYLEDREKAADERYKNFDDEQLRQGKQDLPEGWKPETSKVEVGLTDENIPAGWKCNGNQMDGQTEENIPEGWKLEVVQEQDFSRRMEMKSDKLRMKWAGSDLEIVLENLEMLNPIQVGL